MSMMENHLKHDTENLARMEMGGTDLFEFVEYYLALKKFKFNK